MHYQVQIGESGGTRTEIFNHSTFALKTNQGLCVIIEEIYIIPNSINKEGSLYMFSLPPFYVFCIQPHMYDGINNFTYMKCSIFSSFLLSLTPQDYDIGKYIRHLLLILQ